MPKIKLLSSVTLDQKTTSPDLLALLLKNRKVKPADQPSFLKPLHPKDLTPKDIKHCFPLWSDKICIEEAEKVSQEVQNHLKHEKIEYITEVIQRRI